MLLSARVDHLKQRAERCFAEGDARGALQAYRDAIAVLSPPQPPTPTTAAALAVPAATAADLARLHSNASAVALRASRLDEALEHAESALRSSPRWCKGHWRRGRALLALGRKPESAGAFALAVAAAAAAAAVPGGGGPTPEGHHERRECAAACWDAIARHTRQEVADELLRLLLREGGREGEEQQQQQQQQQRRRRAAPDEASREAAFALVKESDARRRQRRQRQPGGGPDLIVVDASSSENPLDPLAPSAPRYHRLLLHRWLLREASAALLLPAGKTAAAAPLTVSHERAMLAARVSLATRDYEAARTAAAGARSAAEAMMRAPPAAAAGAAAAGGSSSSSAPAAAAQEDDATRAELLGAALAEAALLQGDAWSRFTGRHEGEGEAGGAHLSRPEARAALEAYTLASALAVEGGDSAGAGGAGGEGAAAVAATTFLRPAARRRVARVERLTARLGQEDDDDDDGNDEEPKGQQQQEARALVCVARSPGPLAVAASAPRPPPAALPLPYQYYRLVDGRGLPVERPDKHPFGLSRVVYGGERGAAGAALVREEDVWAELQEPGGDGDEAAALAADAPFLLRRGTRLRWRQTASAVLLRLAPDFASPPSARFAIEIEPYRVRVDALPPPPPPSDDGDDGGNAPSRSSSSALAPRPLPPLPLLDAALERGVAPAESHWTVERGGAGGAAVVVEVHLSKLNLGLLGRPHRHADTWWPRVFYVGGGGEAAGAGGADAAAAAAAKGALVPSSSSSASPSSSFAARASVAFDDYMKDYRDLPALAMREVARERARQHARDAADARDAARRRGVVAADAERRRLRAEAFKDLRAGGYRARKPINIILAEPFDV